MAVSKNLTLYHSLRKKHPFFAFEHFDIFRNADDLTIKWTFNLSGQHFFLPALTIPVSPLINLAINDDLLQNLAFQIGMVELISYWKAACPQRVIIRAGTLSEDQSLWWKTLYFNGLGEFFHVNGISVDFADFMVIETNGEKPFRPLEMILDENVLAPVGGGKDSTVTLGLLQQAGRQVIPFILNPRPATLRTAAAAGFGVRQTLIMHRKLDDQLLRLNEAGYLNGHTPFSALLAFTTLLGSALSNCRYMALSNESSANEPTIPGTNINHQYSKSFAFEKDFRNYVKNYISKDIEYFSFLRPLNELQIGKIFAGLTHQHKHFRSCNAGSKTDSWCCKCPKCLFTWVILAPFVDESQLESIFGDNLMHNPQLISYLDQLSGIAREKPFECVGTIREVNIALAAIVSAHSEKPLPVLLNHFRNSANYTTYETSDLSELLKKFDTNHFLPVSFEKILRKAIS
jgi:UDP-N-acetyl-alpha-D-muramoyl-L-alanyl-L-glutamate epimerase